MTQFGAGADHGTRRKGRQMGFKVNSKVFETEEEARQFSRDLMKRGGLGGWQQTEEPATHFYLGDLMCEPLEDFFGLIKEAKGATV